ncbi:Glycosyltransferase involved in cell wall bisynthesis [Parafrankia irregularis]|uniref:Glycosyltransferase involved in cell wall bisynthesis n=1 Tax=Parafrankia irregularis TaxID=795642 RepID=A0A0S4QYD8_9ACTN|nr:MULTISPECIES: glycosyltransferase family 4 protein [Parafrankia]MBE3203369.1 glycosyltransferase family 4 protein [Parafrankia sp. CH37]CUU60233.1 Glycosyltransferase involved in cell wall bisynthesis [Parafrankia irregularis]
MGLLGTFRNLTVLFFCEQYPPIVWDGAGTYTAALAAALVGLGHNVHVLCAQGRRISDTVENGVHVHRRPLLQAPATRALGGLGSRLRGPLHPRDSLALRTSLAVSYSFWMRQLQLRPDVIETQDGETRALIEAVCHTRPLAIHLHCPTMLAVRLAGQPIGTRGLVADRLDQVSARRAAVVTAPSQLLVDELRRDGWLGDRAVEVIPNLFDATPWRGLPDARATEPTIAVVGRLEPFKGVDVLLDAAARLRAAGVTHRLVVVGRSAGAIGGVESGTWLRGRARELGVDAEFTGHLTAAQIREVFGRARVVAVPSRFESFSLVAVEAIAAGRPVVVTSRTGVAPFVQRWNAGTVVPTGDPAALADALAPFLLDAGWAAAVGEHGRHGVTELEPEAIARRKEAAYLRGIKEFRARQRGAATFRPGLRLRPHRRPAGWLPEPRPPATDVRSRDGAASRPERGSRIDMPESPARTR